MAPLKFFAPHKGCYNRGRLMAMTFGRGAYFAEHGDELAKVNLHYGILYGGVDLYRRCQQAGLHWVHVDYSAIDNRPGYDDADGYFRFSLNSQMSPFRQPSEADWARLDRLQEQGAVNFRPYRGDRPIKRIRYMGPSSYMERFHNLPSNFNDLWRARLTERYPGAQIIGSDAPNVGTVEVDLVASFNSAFGFKAIEAGLDAVMTSPQSMWGAETENLPFENRRRTVFAAMAGRVWNFQEMQSGEALEHMRGNGEIPA